MLPMLRKLMVGNGAGGSQTAQAILRAESILIRGLSEIAMVDRRIKPHDQQQAEAARRAEQRRAFRRNQVFGMLLVAAAIFAWWLIHSKPGWVLPAGWWRL
jgi:hypothetical protein